jgi:hypothetical protein
MLLSLIAVALTFSGCRECKQTGSSISVYTRARAADTGPWSAGVLVVNGQGFSPNKRIDISFKGLPVDKAARSSSWRTDQPIAAKTDANGSFSWSIAIKSSTVPGATWSRYIAALPALDFYADPNGDVVVTAKEFLSPCAAQANLKTGQLLSPPFETAAAADTTKAKAQ